MKLQEKLHRLREENGISQINLAEKLEVSRQTISRWEAGTSVPTTENLMRLSVLYGVPLDEWVKEDWTPSSRPKSMDTGEDWTPQEEAVAEGTKSKRGQRKKRALLIALLLAAGLIVGGLLFIRQRSVSVSMDDLEGEVIDIGMGEEISFVDVSS
ncbi:MAG: helix-turn-helix transcriptional regulator [Lawsonibacter sp.]|jgi:transcriptional regulator with XRE-family HTH domain|nr:helix-turn-helix transcriptional regulator [Lawsonibacter sp.]